MSGRTVRVMEQWEAMLVRVIKKDAVTGLSQISTIEADGNTRVIDNENASVNRAMQVLAELGREGWQLVTIENNQEQAVRLFWLKRRLIPQVDYQPGFEVG